MIWKTIKNHLIQTVKSESIVKVLQGLAEIFRQINSGEDLKLNADLIGKEFLNEIPNAFASLSECMDDLTEELLKDCCDGWSDDLSAVDVLKLRQEAYELNDFGALLESEKNFFWGVIQPMMTPQVSSDQTGNGTQSGSTGGLDGNPNSSQTGVGSVPK